VDGAPKFPASLPGFGTNRPFLGVSAFSEGGRGSPEPACLEPNSGIFRRFSLSSLIHGVRKFTGLILSSRLAAAPGNSAESHAAQADSGCVNELAAFRFGAPNTAPRGLPAPHKAPRVLLSDQPVGEEEIRRYFTISFSLRAPSSNPTRNICRLRVIRQVAGTRT
jgi:hypothetical protein